MGSGLGSLSIPTMLNSVLAVLKNAPDAGFNINIKPIPISQVANVWNETSSDTRTVLIV
jgi:hypothetical protein